MTSADSSVWLVAAYSGFLLAVAYSFDLLARRVARRSQAWRNGSFTYHPGHDAWVCPQDQWLWPTTFDPEQRTMRYRAKPSVCNSCPVKADCTTSAHGREVVREVDPWPHSEAGRFHRGISCAVALIGLLLPVGMLFGSHTPADVVVLALTAVVVLLSGIPLAAHLWQSPSGFPAHVPHAVGVSADVEAAVDRYATRWGIGPQKEKRT
ncbi:MAG TPA: hypothetical protein VK204_13980 [Nocardioidaceae bacterium]|nr:hypothetical protein [Nocardioidaceae bacterium]